jgi:hypothetical protein
MNKSFINIPPHQKTMQSLSIRKGFLFFLTIEINGQILMENTPIY